MNNGGLGIIIRPQRRSESPWQLSQIEWHTCIEIPHRIISMQLCMCVTYHLVFYSDRALSSDFDYYFNSNSPGSERRPGDMGQAMHTLAI